MLYWGYIHLYVPLIWGITITVNQVEFITIAVASYEDMTNQNFAENVYSTLLLNIVLAHILSDHNE